MAWFMEGTLWDAAPAFMSPSLLPSTEPASAFGICTQTENFLEHVSQLLSTNSIPRPLLGLVHSPCPPHRSCRFALQAQPGGPAPRLAFMNSSLPWMEDLLDPLHRFFPSYSLHSLHSSRLTGSTWVGFCPFSHQAQGKVTCRWWWCPELLQYR